MIIYGVDRHRTEGKVNSAINPLGNFVEIQYTVFFFSLKRIIIQRLNPNQVDVCTGCRLDRSALLLAFLGGKALCRVHGEHLTSVF